MNYETIEHLKDSDFKRLTGVQREAGIQEFFAEGNITPLNIFYEDFIQNYEGTVRTILNYLKLDSKSVTVTLPALTQLADDVSEEWAQRFREERQKDWPNLGW